ncbi:hypothetical protein LPW11_08615 [Geomonas sp. RF6]|uniref:hypothetical protein n=1 Tax=Geomonas sp. RF6 TaxID=2897342 RepID=UPI001E2980CD|nr:hypothetical protein [Geomonas sp. RF6]UFS72241.1 hypothetical protein LPW11_08615 [Geomonas sp. RF6]
MNKKVKSVVLSALVLPGLGQLYLGRKVKGGIMLLLDNLFILGALAVVLRSAGKILAAGRSEAPDAAQLVQAVHQDAPFVRWLGLGFLFLWAFGVVDALLDKGEQ